MNNLVYLSDKTSNKWKPAPKIPQELLDKNEIKEYHLSKMVIKPAAVWANYFNEKTPTYAFIDCGTNCLKIFKYNGEEWSKVDIEEIPPGEMYSVVWQMVVEQKV